MLGDINKKIMVKGKTERSYKEIKDIGTNMGYSIITFSQNDQNLKKFGPPSPLVHTCSILVPPPPPALRTFKTLHQP